MRLDFSDKKILIIGDVMIDRYYNGDVSRISPEAPVPVVKVNDVAERLGGACNVANNIACLRAKPLLIGIATDDSNGLKVKKMLDEIESRYDFLNTGNRTTAKLRVIGSRQQIVRLDFEDEIKLTNNDTSKLIKIIDKNMKTFNHIVISDYGKGVCSETVCKHIISNANKSGKIVIVDPKGADWSKYTSATIITPNVKELSEVVGSTVRNIDSEIEKFGKIILNKYKLKHLVVTRSDKGISVISSKTVKHFEAKSREVFDVSGAGDTVVAAIICCLAKGLDIEEATVIANLAAGIVVGKAHTVPVTIEELNEDLEDTDDNSKILPLPKLLKMLDNDRRLGKKIVFTNGCFDILHLGHTTYLHTAKTLGDKLIVGLNSDSSVKRLKGLGRPINNQKSRALVLAALSSVDYITVFDEDTPLDIIKAIAPDILVKGADYKIKNVVGRQYAKDVKLISFVDGFSTTKIIEKMKK